MLGLICAVYLLLAYMSVRERDLPRTIVPTVMAVGIVVGLWVFAPEFLVAGSLGVPFAVRQTGLAVGGVAVVARYIAIRRVPEAEDRSSMSGKLAAILTELSTPLLGICMAVASANWLVAIAAAVLVATVLVRRAVVSARADSTTPPPPPDTE